MNDNVKKAIKVLEEALESIIKCETNMDALDKQISEALEYLKGRKQ